MARLKIWDAGTSQWKYVDCSSGGPTELDHLTDVVINGVQNNQHLVYLSASGQWYNYTVPTSLTSPGGLDSYIQYNDGGVFGGESAFTYDKNANRVVLDSTSDLTVSGTATYRYASSLAIVAGTSPVVDSAGEIAIDTDADGNLIDQGLIIYHDGVQKMFVPAVDTLPSVSGMVLTYDGTNDRFFFGPQSDVPIDLDDLTDVSIIGLQDRQLLQYISTSGQWHNTNFDGSMLSIGVPGDGSYGDGLVSLTTNTILSTALDSINEAILGISGQVQAINPSLALADLTDVSISGVQNGQILRYFSVSGQWFNTRFCASDLPICLPSDGSWSDGINSWTSTTTTADALDDLNETLSYLAPDDAGPLAGALTMAGTTKYTGFLSAGTGQNFSAADPAGDSVTYIITDTTFTLTGANTSTSFNKADEGTCTWHSAVGAGAYGANDVVNLASNFNEGERATTQTGTPWTTGQLSVNSVGWYNSFPKWQKGNATITITAAQLSQGYNKIKMSREGSFSTQESSDYEVFYDNSGGTITVATPTVAENSAVTGKLSGVNYYIRTSSFNISCTSLTSVFANCYSANSFTIAPSADSWFTSTSFAYTDGTVSGISTPPDLSETAAITNKSVSVPASNVRSINARASVSTTHPWRGSVSATSASANRLINAYLNNASGTSSDTSEPFDDEWYRLLSNFNIDSTSYSSGGTGGWDSTESLVDAGTAGYNNGLQLYNGTLIRPVTNFSSGYLPSTSQPNYSTGVSGNRVYIRYFYVGAGAQNFTWTFSGTTATIVSVATGVSSNNLTFEMLAPATTSDGASTVWKDCYTSYTTDTAVGCYTGGTRSLTSTSSWVTTLGTKSTSTSGNVICVRITASSAWTGNIATMSVVAS